MEKRREYYRIVNTKSGKKFLYVDNNRVFANALAFTSEVRYWLYDNEDGTKRYSFVWSERLEEIAELLIKIHEESLELR